jgi:hypothetical protein
MKQLRIALLVAAAAAFLGAAPIPFHVRGTIVSTHGSSSITVATARGNVVVMLPPKTGVAAVVPGSQSDIKSGTFIGTANVQGGATDRALEVVVFPDAMRGTGEGNYAWDLTPHSSGSSMMTNGTVANGSGTSMMTNGNVKSATGHGQMTLTVTYKGGQQRIIVPANVSIVRLEPGSPALLMRGAHVFVIATGDPSHPVAQRVVVGKDGAVPPM